MLEHARKFFNPTEQEKYLKWLEDFRQKHIPKRYNQVKLLDELANIEIDHYVSISNRTDGKTFNYIHALLNIAINHNTGLFFISRNMMLRDSYITLLEKIIDMSSILERGNFQFIRQTYFITVNYKKRTIGVISDLNQATQLKNYSNFIKDYPIMIYDEFLALESDYLPDEWERLKTIYESIDRNESYPLVIKPKIFYFGNAINFSSPILSGMNLYNALEKHKINTSNQYDNIMLEMHKNENANKARNTRAFDSDDDEMTTGQFKINNHNIAPREVRKHVEKDLRVIYVKLEDNFLEIKYNKTTFTIILNIIGFADYEYTFNLQLKDSKKESTYLREDKYFNSSNIRKIVKNAYYFENQYSRDYITTFHNLNMLDIAKIIRENEVSYIKLDKSKFDITKEQYEQNYLRNSKRSLMRKFWN